MAAVLEDPRFQIGSDVAQNALATAKELSQWLNDHREQAKELTDNLLYCLHDCLYPQGSQSERGKMWGEYDRY